MINMVLSKKQLRKIWEQVPPDYYEKGIEGNIFQRTWHNWKWQALKSFLTKIDPNPKKILDVGCASGHITSRIAQLFPSAKVIGVDAYKKTIDYGQKIHPEVQFLHADAHKLPFDNNTFGIVTCIETLEHVLNPPEVLAEIHRVLARKGVLVIGQDTDSLLFNIIWGIWTKTKGRVWAGSHLHPFKPKELEKLFRDLGFKILEKRYSQFGLEVFIKCQKD